MQFNRAFNADYRRVVRAHPYLKAELDEVFESLSWTGTVPASYSPHVLSNPGGLYNGHTEFHLSDGRIDVLVLYMPHKTNPVIRLVRMGSHDELFRG